MSYPCCSDPAWYHALTLAERVASLPASPDQRPDRPLNRDIALRRFERWRAQTPFISGTYFADRLADLGVSVDTFQALLGEPIEHVAERLEQDPDWLKLLTDAFTGPATARPALPPELVTAEQRAFLHVAEPLVAQGRAELRTTIEALARHSPALPIDVAQLETVMLALLPARLLPLLTRTMILELHIARLQGLLTGTTAAERFQSFGQRLQQREIALELLKHYPPLARQLVRCVRQWVACSSEFLQQLYADWELICATFSPVAAPGRLTGLTCAGDQHRGGRAVLIAHFEHGLRLVYKPTSLASAVHFQELLDWINARGATPDFRTLRVLDRGTYGWVEWATPHDCTSDAQVQRFYQRQGGYLALLYALEATDFHAENIIAAGEHPLLIDLETLFHPRLETDAHNGQSLPGGEQLTHSVLRVGLLPEQAGATAAQPHVDLSGLGQASGQLTPYAVPVLEAAGTDSVHIARKRVNMSAAQNQPTLCGAAVDVRAYTGAIITGFTRIYRLLIEHRAALLAPDGPVARFAHDQIRVIVRDTQTYATLLDESAHPDLLRTALDRDRFFDKLWVAVQHKPALKQVIAAERADLEQCDIPLLSGYVDSCDVWSSCAGHIAGLFAVSGLTQVRQRIAQLGADDLQRQRWIIQVALLPLRPVAAIAPPRQAAVGHVLFSHQRALDAATIIAERLATLAIQGRHDAGWIGLTPGTTGQCALRPLGVDLYDGLPGVALFLAHCGALTGQQRFTMLAQRAVQAMLCFIEQRADEIGTIGGFSGWGGLVYSLAQLGTLWQQPALLEQALRCLPLIAPLVSADRHLDIVDGAAGCIGGLLALAQCTGAATALDMARHCGQHLLAHARPERQGLSWTGAIPARRALTGFAHGAAGIGWALAELGAATGEHAFRAAARAAISYERSLFDVRCGGWPDLRLPAEGHAMPQSMAAWCHGAAGIGLMRLHLLRQHDSHDPSALRGEVRVAAQHILEQGYGHNHSLCHGDLGSLELLTQASTALADPVLRTQAQQISAALVAAVEVGRWRCGTPQQVESPGLMTGLAGIGYGLLRLAAPERVPSVLLMARPRAVMRAEAGSGVQVRSV